MNKQQALLVSLSTALTMSSLSASDFYNNYLIKNASELRAVSSTKWKQLARRLNSDIKIRQQTIVDFDSRYSWNKEYANHWYKLFNKYLDTWLIEEPHFTYLIIDRIFSFQTKIKIKDYKNFRLHIKHENLQLILDKNIQITEEFIVYLKPKYEEAKEMNELFGWTESYIDENREVLEALA